MKSFIVKTDQKEKAIDITSKIESLLEVDEGICLIYIPHTSCGITINEMDNLEFDIPNFLDKLIPKNNNYLHEGGMGNADAHIKTTIVGNSVIIPINKKRLILGTWQHVMLLEFDGPRQRKIIVTCLEK